METNGIGALKRQEVNVKDAGSVTPQLVVKGKHLRGSRKRGCRRKHLNQRKGEKKSKRQEESEDEKGRKYKRLTATFATTYTEANNSSENDE